MVAATKRNKFVFAEVKNWGEGSWVIGMARDDVIEQLRQHNDGIRKFLAESSAGPGDVERKLLMVVKDGFMELDSVARAQFTKQVENLGWGIETIASTKIESVAEFIDRLR